MAEHMLSHVALFLPTLESGGAERAFVELANRFSAMGTRTDLVLVRAVGPYLDEVSDGVRVIDLGGQRVLRAIPLLAGYLRRETPEVIMSGLDNANVAAIAACAIVGRPSAAVLTQRSILRECWRLQHPRLHRAWLAPVRLAYSRARLIISNSRAASDDLRDGFGIPQSRLAVVHNSVDLERIERQAKEAPRHRWTDDGAPPMILSVGSLTTGKDVTTLLRAFSIVRRTHDCNLLILGEGPERTRLEAMAQQLGIGGALEFRGFDPNPFCWMARAALMASSTLAEGCPNVIQQALACGTPIVATDCPGGTSEILEDGKWGKLVPVGNPEAMATAIRETLDDTSPPDGRRRARDFDPERNAQEYLRLLSSHAARHGGPRHPAPRRDTIRQR